MTKLGVDVLLHDDTMRIRQHNMRVVNPPALVSATGH